VTQMQWLPTANASADASAFLPLAGHAPGKGSGAAALFGAWLDSELSNAPQQDGQMPGDIGTAMPVLLADPSLLPSVTMPAPTKAAAGPAVEPGLIARPQMTAGPATLPEGSFPRTAPIHKDLIAAPNGLPEGLIARPTLVPEALAPTPTTTLEAVAMAPDAMQESGGPSVRPRVGARVLPGAQEMPTQALTAGTRPVSQMASATADVTPPTDTVESAADAVMSRVPNVPPNARAPRITSAMPVRQNPETRPFLGPRQAPREAEVTQANAITVPVTTQNTPASPAVAESVPPEAAHLPPAIQTTQIAPVSPAPGGASRETRVVPDAGPSDRIALPAPDGRPVAPPSARGAVETPMPSVTPIPNAIPEPTATRPAVAAVPLNHVTPREGLATPPAVAGRPIPQGTPVSPEAPTMAAAATPARPGDPIRVTGNLEEPRIVRVASTAVREHSGSPLATPVAPGRQVRMPTPMVPGRQAQVPVEGAPVNAATPAVLPNTGRHFLSVTGLVAPAVAPIGPALAMSTAASATVPVVSSAADAETVFASVTLGDPHLRRASSPQSRAHQTSPRAAQPGTGMPGVVPTTIPVSVLQPGTRDAAGPRNVPVTEAVPVTPEPARIQARVAGVSADDGSATPTQLDGMSAATPRPSPVRTPAHNAPVPAAAMSAETWPTGRPRAGEGQRTSPGGVSAADSATDPASDTPGLRGELSGAGTIEPTRTSPDATPISATARARHIVNRVSRGVSAGQETLDLAVDWDDIGVTRVVVRMGEHRAQVEVSCVSVDAANSVRELVPAIRQQLEAQGLELGDFSAWHETDHGQGTQTADRWADQRTYGLGPEPRPATGSPRTHRQARPARDADNWSGTLNVLA